MIRYALRIPSGKFLAKDGNAYDLDDHRVPLYGTPNGARSARNARANDTWFYKKGGVNKWTPSGICELIEADLPAEQHYGISICEITFASCECKEIDA